MKPYFFKRKMGKLFISVYGINQNLWRLIGPLRLKWFLMG